MIFNNNFDTFVRRVLFDKNSHKIWNTGGWVQYEPGSYSLRGVVEYGDTMHFESSVVMVEVTEGYFAPYTKSAISGTNKPVNLDGISNIYVKSASLSVNGFNPTYNQGRIGVSKTAPHLMGTNPTGEIFQYIDELGVLTNDGTANLDVSELSGEYYIYIALALMGSTKGTVELDVERVWAE